MMIDLLFNIILLIGVAMFSIEFVDSNIATTIKRFLGIDEDKGWMKAFSTINTYYQVLPKWMWFTIVIPIFVLIIIFLIGVLRIIISLVNCPVCSGFHYGWAFAFFYLGYPLLPAIALGALVVLFIKLIDRHVTFK